MDSDTLLVGAFLGVIEGFTEFIPVSSTGHLLLAGHFLGFDSPGNTFEVLIQLGAILAILAVYFTRLWTIAMAIPHDPSARRFVIGIVIAFLPAAIVGVLAHGFIKEVLFETPTLVCVTLVIGGFVLLWIDRLPLQPAHTDATGYPISLCLKIGLCQCLAMIPGVSRSGATIGGALLLGCDKRSAAEFSFFLAIPTMAGAFAYDLYQNIDRLGSEDIAVIAVGFVCAFIAAVLVVRALLDFVSRHGFAPFAWWRIAVGSVGLVGLWLTG